MPDQPNPPRESTEQGVILRASNGDVIGYDETGLILRLSDRVVADLSERLRLSVTAASDKAAPAQPLPDDLDAWNIRQEGEWICFDANLPGAQGPRGFRRHVTGGAVIAQARGPLLGILGIGGARAALANPGAGSFPWHVLAPADDIGAVGHAGVELAVETAHLEPLREQTHEALLAEVLLADRRAASQALPLYLVRAETDSAARAADLGHGRAVENLERAAANLIAAGATLGTGARLLAVTLDYCLEDISGDATAYRDGIIALMARLTDQMNALGQPAPRFLATFDCGTHEITDGAALDGQWELSWNHADHALTYVAPGYMFALDDTGRLTEAGRRTKAAMGAAALTALEAGQDWFCPTIQLAERAGKDIRLTCKAMDKLVVEKADPFDAGKAAGFRLDGVTNGARITGIAIDPDDSRTLVLSCSKRPKGTDLVVAYAAGATAWNGPWPANRGAVRDAWSRSGPDGQPLHRWALPARLRVTGA